MIKQIIARIIATLLVATFFVFPFALVGLKIGLFVWAGVALLLSLIRLFFWCIENWN